MYKAKDGRQFAHEGMGKSWDSHIAANPKAAMNQKEDGASVVAMHGPAHETRIVKAGDKHVVHSHHKDGHVHKSGPMDLKGAHDHSMAMHGHNEENPQEDQMGELNESPSLDNEASQAV
jgi:hypothetical protein